MLSILVIEFGRMEKLGIGNPESGTGAGTGTGT